MRRKWPVVAAVAVIAVGAAGWIAWGQTHTAGVRNGHAFGPDGASPRIGMTTVRKGDDVWFISPVPVNLSDAALTLEKVTPASSQPGLDFVGARVYQKDDFVSGVPLSWGTADGSSSSPGRVPSKEVQGYKLEAGQQMSDYMFLHFRVSTTQRPLEASGVKIAYAQKGRKFEQVLPATYRLDNRSASGN